MSEIEAVREALSRGKFGLESNTRFHACREAMRLLRGRANPGVVLRLIDDELRKNPGAWVRAKARRKLKP